MRASLCGGLIVLVGPATAQTVIDGSGANISRQDQATIIKEVAKFAIDPLSAQFRNIRVGKKEMRGLPTFCGEVNAKNRFGGYVGFMPFAAWGVSTDIKSIVGED